jgi:hypothetical protein
MKTGIAMCFVTIILAGVVVTAQETAEAEARIELGATIGLLWFTDTPQMTTVGAVLAIPVASGLTMRISGSRTAIELFGVELLSITVASASLCLDLSAQDRLGLYVLGGGSYLLASALGEGISGIAANAGIGLRVTPTPTLKLFVEYCPLIKYGVMHAARIGVSVLF